MNFRKYLSLLGIGSAKINLILEKEFYKPGECVSGYFLISGGSIEQNLKRIECDLILIDKAEAREAVIETSTILTSRRINCDEANQIPFRFHLPESLLESKLEVCYKFKTNLIFHEGVKSVDLDEIKVMVAG